MNVSIVISDPSKFGTECGVGPFDGFVVVDREGAYLIRLARTIHCQGKDLAAVVARLAMLKRTCRLFTAMVQFR